MIAIAIILIIILALLFCLKGRNGHPETAKMKSFYYAHRGLHQKPDLPENSLAAFQKAVDNGFGCELDVHLLKDSGLCVIHDSLLKRTTGLDGVVEDLTLADLSSCFLEGTQETIPTLKSVLQIFEGKTPLIIELKSYKGNVEPLCQELATLLDNYKGTYCIESFDPRCVAWFRKNRPQTMRGQLSADFMHHPSGMGRLVDFVQTYLLCNVMVRPDFVAYNFESRKNLSNTLCRRLFKITGVSWTLKTKQQFDEAIKEGYIGIFEGFMPQ